MARMRSLSQALREAVLIHRNETVLIECNRDRESGRWTADELRRDAEAFGGRLQAAVFKPGDRLAILMSNQSKWIIAGLGGFWIGATLVPLDYKLTPPEQMALIGHSRPKFLVVEWGSWEKLREEPRGSLSATRVIVTEAPPDADLGGAARWEEPAPSRFALAERSLEDVATIIYSSGTGGRPKGCQLTHANYLSQIEPLADIVRPVRGDVSFSILPTNHAIDFMCGFLMPLFRGFTILHQRTLRSQYLRSTMQRYGVTLIALVPMLLKSFKQGITDQLEALPPWKQKVFRGLVAINRLATKRKPHPAFSRLLFGKIHAAFGGRLRQIIVGGAFVDPSLAQFFYDIGLPVAIGYGTTEAGTAITLNDLRPFRSDTVGKPLPCTRVKVVNPDASGVGEIFVKGPTVMKGYLDDPDQTEEVLKDGWLKTGDLGTMDREGHVRLLGRAKNMIVTDGGKNVYPEDVEITFQDLAGCKEYCVFAANYIWPTGRLTGEKLMIVLHPENGRTGEELAERLRERNRTLADYKRLSSYVVWGKDFPRTASMKIKRNQLMEELRAGLSREAALTDL
jgi:long-chain acyl-CoA synthetase